MRDTGRYHSIYASFREFLSDLIEWPGSRKCTLIAGADFSERRCAINFSQDAARLSRVIFIRRDIKHSHALRKKGITAVLTVSTWIDYAELQGEKGATSATVAFNANNLP